MDSPLKMLIKYVLSTYLLKSIKTTRGKLARFTGHLAHVNPASSGFVPVETNPDFPPLDLRFPLFLRLGGEAREVGLVARRLLPSVANFPWCKNRKNK